MSGLAPRERGQKIRTGTSNTVGGNVEERARLIGLKQNDVRRIVRAFEKFYTALFFIVAKG